MSGRTDTANAAPTSASAPMARHARLHARDHDEPFRIDHDADASARTAPTASRPTRPRASASGASTSAEAMRMHEIAGGRRFAVGRGRAGVRCDHAVTTQLRAASPPKRRSRR